MIVDFPRERDLFVFFEEGDLEALRQGSVEGLVYDSEDPGVLSGEALVRYEEDTHGSRPGVARYSGEGVDDVEVVLGDSVLDSLEEGGVYSDGVSDYQEVPSDAAVKFFPPGEYENFDSTYQALAGD